MRVPRHRRAAIALSHVQRYGSQKGARASTAFTPRPDGSNHQRIGVQLRQLFLHIHGEVRHAHQGIRACGEVRRWPGSRSMRQHLGWFSSHLV